MENISSILSSEYYWQSFLNTKLEEGHLSKSDRDALKSYVENREYEITAKAYTEGGTFPYPTACTINKQFTGKKRMVFKYPEGENLFLKFIAYHLSRYDRVFAPNLCSFRKNVTVKKVIKGLAATKGINGMYSYKVDVRDYFNSVDIDKLLPMLKFALSDDGALYSFLAALLKNPYSIKDGEKTEIKKGIMAGVPTSSFLANLYLSEVDNWFYAKGISYIRYSDDIIIFADTEKKISLYAARLKEMLSERGLEINSSKECYVSPGEGWEFLGFSYYNGIVDVSAATLDKLKKKLKRKARALFRWKVKKGASDERAIRAFIKSFNMKLYDNPNNSELTWARWYFPVITTDKSLHAIDVYMQDCIRYIATGNYSKIRYNLRYEQMKEYGYRSLVNEYYKGKAMD